jgi:hypothetical protein
VKKRVLYGIDKTEVAVRVFVVNKDTGMYLHLHSDYLLPGAPPMPVVSTEDPEGSADDLHKWYMRWHRSVETVVFNGDSATDLEMSFSPSHSCNGNRLHYKFFHEYGSDAMWEAIDKIAGEKSVEAIRAEVIAGEWVKMRDNLPPEPKVLEFRKDF